MPRKKILFLMSDTGGGHRAACQAILAALDEKYPQEFSGELVDMWREYTPFPFNTMPKTYGAWVNRYPKSYEVQFWLTDRIFRAGLGDQFYKKLLFPRIQKQLKHRHADLVVCVHSVFVRPSLQALKTRKIPFITVVTDYAKPTSLWYDRRADKTLVPVQPAYELGLSLGLDPKRLLLTGPVLHPRFSKMTLSKLEARQQLGWDKSAKIALLVGGGDGMGPLLETAKAIDANPVDAQLVVLAGKNLSLQQALEAVNWRKKTQIYGFTSDFDIFLRAADILISKAGPATITEAAALGTPMILNGAIKYQELPNAEYVVAQGAGLYAEGAARVAATLERVLSTPQMLESLEAGVKKLADPLAVYRIADEIWGTLQMEKGVA
ncbi:MAG: MGDG synthase family glycosyltransferase [Deinococcales bacterium]